MKVLLAAFAMAATSCGSAERSEAPRGCVPACSANLACDREKGQCYDPVWANWPMPNARVPGLPRWQTYDTTLAWVVKDLVTGLEWQRDVMPDVVTWVDAEAYCGTLSLEGHDDWRLPSAVELVSIVNVVSSAPSIDTLAFPSTSPDYFWSSSPVFAAEALWWAVNFNTGYVNDNGAAAGNPRVRCVSGGTSTGHDSRYAVTERTIAAPFTQLTWQRNVTLPMDWKSAVAYCAALALDGTGWRLPTVGELVALTDYTRSNPALDPAFQGSPTDSPYWASSQLAADGTQAWHVSAYSGNMFYSDITSAYYARCVR